MFQMCIHVLMSLAVCLCHNVYGCCRCLGCVIVLCYMCHSVVVLICYFVFVFGVFRFQKNAVY